MIGSEIVVAELPGGAGRGQDRCRIADGLAIVLDGASAFDKQANPDASDYVEHLADELLRIFVGDPRGDLRAGLAYAIETTAKELDIVPGQGPSSTVAVARWGPDTVDTLVLGDSTIVVCTDAGRDALMDGALAAIAPEVRSRYRNRLAAGNGFSAMHLADLAELQRHQAAHRNRPGGYWIAEADPKAARHALVHSYPSEQVVWLVAATDGAQQGIDHLNFDWDSIARSDAESSFDLLVDLHHWESHNDPDGARLPRSKRHDDKALVIARLRDIG